MSRTTRGRSNERTNASPARKAGMSTKDRNGTGAMNLSGLAASAAAANPETPAEMSERLIGERRVTLDILSDQSESHVIAEMIGFSLAKEIGERACDLYINTTYDELANEYTAEALWDEMMDAISSFSQAVPAVLPTNASGTASIYSDPNALPSPNTLANNNNTSSSTSKNSPNASPSSSRPSSAGAANHNIPHTAASIGFVRRLPAPGILPPKEEENNNNTPTKEELTPDRSNFLKNPTSGVAAKSALKSGGGGGGGTVSAGASPSKTETAAATATTTATTSSSTVPGGEQKKEKRRVRLTVTDPEDEKKEEAKKAAESEAPMKDRKLSAREQLQKAVEDRLKEEQEQREKELSRSPLYAQLALAKLVFDLEPPSEADPSWLPDEPPVSMYCDLTARHAAGLKLKTVDPQQLAQNLGISSAGSQMGGLDGTMAGLGATTGGGLGATSRMGRSMTLSSGTARRSIVGRPGSGTVVGRSGSGGPSSSQNSANARPLSPTQLVLNEVSKESVPIHILTHNLSMMASVSPYLAMKRKQQQEQQQDGMTDSSHNRSSQRHWAEDGAPPDLDDTYENAIAGGNSSSRMPPTSRGDTVTGGSNAFGDSGDQGPGAIPTIPIPDAVDQESSAFESMEDDDVSVQSPSEQEVTQRIQLRQAQKTRNNNAFNTISNQLAELTNPKSTQSSAASPTSGINQTAADKNLIVDARLGRVIPVTSIEAATGGKKAGSKANPLTESPRFNVVMPAPPPTEPPANSREARLARRQVALQSRSSAPTAHIASTTGEGEQQQAQQQQAPTTGRTSSRSYSPFRNDKKKKRRDNDPSNFFEPEAKVPPMVQLLNPSGGVAVKDDNGSRRNERPQQPSKLSKEDYKKIVRMAPQNNNNSAANDFGWGNIGPASTSAMSPSNGGGDGFSFKRQDPQTARQQQSSAATATASNQQSKTARR
jgi:hypothetical protein